VSDFEILTCSNCGKEIYEDYYAICYIDDESITELYTLCKECLRQELELLRYAFFAAGFYLAYRKGEEAKEKYREIKKLENKVEELLEQLG